MKILILRGSPHPDGTTAFLSTEFSRAAKKAGHEIMEFDTTKLNINFCQACYHCRRNIGECIFDDDMLKIIPHLLEAEGLVLVTPLYYFNITGQLKRVIDRFFAINAELKKKPKKLYLISAGNDKEEWIMDTLKANIQALCRYLNWQEGGMVLALDSDTKEDVGNSKYQEMAKNLGASV